MNFRQPAIYIILLVSIGLALGYYYFQKTKKTNTATKTTTETTTKTTISNLTNVDPADFDTITKRTYTNAESNALMANASNALAAIDIQVDKDLSPDTLITRYVFNSANDTKNNWVMTISSTGDRFVRALIPVDDYMGTLTQVNTKAWKYNFVTALQLAEKNGGLSWREGKTLSGVNLVLRHGGKKNWLLWIVEYQSASGNLPIMLDANSGRVVTE